MANLSTALINGQSYDWSSISLLIAGVPVYGVTSITYLEEQTIEDNYGLGRRAVTRSFGEIVNTGSITFQREELVALEQAAPNGRIQDIAPFDIIVAYLPPGVNTKVVHVLKQCQFKNNGVDTSQGDTTIEQSIDLAIAQIDWKPNT